MPRGSPERGRAGKLVCGSWSDHKGRGGARGEEKGEVTGMRREGKRNEKDEDEKAWKGIKEEKRK